MAAAPNSDLETTAGLGWQILLAAIQGKTKNGPNVRLGGKQYQEISAVTKWEMLGSPVW